MKWRQCYLQRLQHEKQSWCRNPIKQSTCSVPNVEQIRTTYGFETRQRRRRLRRQQQQQLEQIGRQNNKDDKNIFKIC